MTGATIAWSAYSTISNAKSLCLEHQDQNTVVNNVYSVFGYNEFAVNTIGDSVDSEL